MPSITLSDLARTRIQTISFFLVVFLLCSWVVRLIRNGLRKDFSWLPILSFRRAMGLVGLWGLLFVLVLQRAEPVLKTLGSTIRHAGPVRCGALAKLATNMLMGVQMAALAELIGMLKRQQVDAKQILDAVSATAMWNPHLTRDAESMLTDNFETQFPVQLLEKDLGYAVQTGGGEPSMPTVSAVQSIFRRAIDENLGNLNMTAVAKLFSKER